MIAAVLTSLPLRLVPLNEYILRVQDSSATDAQDERRLDAIGRSPGALRVIVAATAIGDDDVEGLCGNATHAIADLVFGTSAAALDRASTVAATPGAVDALFSVIERYAGNDRHHAAEYATFALAYMTRPDLPGGGHAAAAERRRLIRARVGGMDALTNAAAHGSSPALRQGATLALRAINSEETRATRATSATCAACGATERLKKCSCRTVRYCSVACQHQHWPEHKDACHAARGIPDSQPPGSS